MAPLAHSPVKKLQRMKRKVRGTKKRVRKLGR